jgi:hypothetical protein
MSTVPVGQLTFAFPAGWQVSKYDQWSFYINRVQRFLQGAKGVDLLAISPERTVFLIEVKDYRLHRRIKTISMADEVIKKVVDTLAAILPCKLNGDEASETIFSSRVLRGECLKVVLHLEQPVKHSKLFPRAIDPADVQMKLRRQMKPIDAHPLVVEKSEMRGLPWAAQ